MSQKLKVSARASIKSTFASASAKSDYLSQIKQNSYTVYLVVTTTVLNAEDLLDMSISRLMQDADNLFSGNPDKFKQVYGDSFVYSIIKGGEFLGVLEIESSSESEYRSIKGKLSGSVNFGAGSGSASASVKDTLSQLASSYELRATMLRDGSTGEIAQAVNTDEFIKGALPTSSCPVSLDS